jgi:tRNA (guanine-N7-)-methyltransferase
MRPPDPQWEALAQAPFARWIPEADLKYHADAIRRLIAMRDLLPPLSTPVEVEVGSNRGRFLSGLCAGRPNAHFLGLEIKRSLCDVANRRLARHHLPNGQALHVDARFALPIFFHDRPLHGLYVLFPDPWWKKRHARRRLLDVPFLSMAHDLMPPGAHFVLKTDVPFYLDATREVFDALPNKFTPIQREDVPASDTWHLTTRERHCVEDGTPFYALFMRRI